MTGPQDGTLAENWLTRALYRLQDLPGYAGRTFGRKLRRRLARQLQLRFGAWLAELTPSDICLDLGANVGVFTELLARTGARVHAYEPDPVNFAALKARVGELANVTLHQAAVGATSGRLTMYRPLAAMKEPGDMASQGVTGQFRPGLSDGANSFEVDLVAFDAILAGLGGPVRLVKIDIEGAELDILSALASGQMRVECDEIFVETHEKQYPGTWPQVRRLRHRFRKASRPAIFPYWI